MTINKDKINDVSTNEKANKLGKNQSGQNDLPNLRMVNSYMPCK